MEGYDESTYGRAFADVYDDWYGDDPRLDDLLSTVEALTRSIEGPLVELGAGTGRLTAPIAQRVPNRQIIAIDSSSEMLDRLKVREGCEHVDRVLGDMVDAGQPLYRIHASTEYGLDAARTKVAEDPAYRVREN